MSFSLADSHSYPGKKYSQNAFPSGTPGTFQHWTTQHNGTEIFKVPLDSAIFTRSLGGLYEICTRSGFCKGRQQGKAAGQGSRARQQGKAAGQGTLRCSTPLYSSLLTSLLFSSQLCSTLFYSSLLCSTPLQSLLLFNLILFFTLLYTVSSTVLSSVWVKLLRSHPQVWVLSQRICLKNTCVPLQSVRKINATNNWFMQKEWHVYHGLPNGTLFAAQEDNRSTSYHPDTVISNIYWIWYLYII